MGSTLHCQFLSAFTPLQSRYTKRTAEPDHLFAVIIAQAMNHGTHKMATIGDIPYHTLDWTYQQYLRLATLQLANDKISNAIAKLSIFSHYNITADELYGSVDGQKYEMLHPTAKARYSRKYFNAGQGVVAYTLLANHVPLQDQMIGAHQHESYFVFDILYNNTSDIVPTAISGDMHSINRANFAVLDWFGYRFTPRFTQLQAQLKHLYSSQDKSTYQGCLIQPVGKINQQLIIDEWDNLQHIIVTLARKEATQNHLIRKLCTYSCQNRTRKALFEYDKLIRSLYLLDYLGDRELQRAVHRSQNRLEGYHQLRAAIAEVNGSKQLTGCTDIAVAISNQCGRLIANAIIYYNSALLSLLLNKHQSSGNTKALALIQRISPVAWQHIHLLGHYIFCNRSTQIDLEAIVKNLQLI